MGRLSVFILIHLLGAVPIKAASDYHVIFSFLVTPPLLALELFFRGTYITNFALPCFSPKHKYTIIEMLPQRLQEYPKEELASNTGNNTVNTKFGYKRDILT